MKRDTWQRAIKSTKRKRELEEVDALPLHLREPAQNPWGGHKSQVIKAYGDYLFSANNGRKLYQEEIEAWSKKDNAFRTRFEIRASPSRNLVVAI